MYEVLWRSPEKKKKKKKLLEISEFIKVRGYKIDLQKSIVILCTGNEQSDNEIQKTVAFTIAPRRIKY